MTFSCSKWKEHRLWTGRLGFDFCRGTENFFSIPTSGRIPLFSQPRALWVWRLRLTKSKTNHCIPFSAEYMDPVFYIYVSYTDW